MAMTPTRKRDFFNRGNRPTQIAEIQEGLGQVRPGFAQIQQNPALLPVAMNRGGSLNLNSSSLNRGIGQLPPMQQNDKLTQLFAQSFNPRR